MLQIYKWLRSSPDRKKAMLHISRSVSSACTHLWCFRHFSLSLSKDIADKLMETFDDLKWPWQHEEGPLAAIFRFRTSILHITRCLRVFRIVFVQKRRLSIFSHWLLSMYNRKTSQNWPDLKSPISKLRDIHFIDTVMDIIRWKFLGDQSFFVSMISIQTFSEVRSLDMTWSWVTWVWDFLQHARKRCVNMCVKKRCLQEKWEGVQTPLPNPHPHPTHTAPVNPIPGGLRRDKKLAEGSIRPPPEISETNGRILIR